MRAMVFRGAGPALALEERPVPAPGPEEILVRVAACGVCRTDLHLVDGELPEPRLPVVPGHEVVGRVAALGAGVGGFREGDRVGIPWLGWTCGACPCCRRGRENLCPTARFTGYTGTAATPTTASRTTGTRSVSRGIAATRSRRRCSARG